MVMEENKFTNYIWSWHIKIICALKLIINNVFQFQSNQFPNLDSVVKSIWVFSSNDIPCCIQSLLLIPIVKRLLRRMFSKSFRKDFRFEEIIRNLKR